MEATGSRFRPLIRTLISSPSSRTLQAHNFFSSSSCYQSYRSHPVSLDDSEDRGTGSVVYRKTLKTQRPSTIRWKKELVNHASFIGRVNSPLKTLTTGAGILLARTQLKVESPSGSNRFLTIFLDMWEDMAELSIQHLKPNDYIYVSGYLQSYTKACDNGNITLTQKVNVKEINYVARNDKKTKNIEDLGESGVEKQRKRLNLWQVFFSNPHEWRDLRKCKTNPRQPDFIHKGTGEALWISVYDPPWVTRQLKLQDSRMGDMGLGQDLKYRSNLSSFEL